MMHHRIIWLISFLLTIVFTEGTPTSLSAFGRNYSIYRVKTRHPVEEFRDDESNIVTNIEDVLWELPLEIQPVGQHTGWKSEVVSNTELKKHMCSENGDNCPRSSKVLSGVSPLPCPESLAVTKYGGCLNHSSNEIILSGTSGNILIDDDKYTWIIQAPTKDAAIRLELTSTSQDYDYYIENLPFLRLTVYHAYLEESDEESTTRVWISTEGYIKIQVKSFSGSHGRFFGTYQTGIYSLVSTIYNKKISIRSPFGGCYSLTYYSPFTVTATPAPVQQSENFVWKTTSMEGNERWNTMLLYVPPLWGGRNVDINFYERGTRVYSLTECLPIEKYILVPSGETYGSKGNCLNGGGVHNETGTCLCPMGFAGEYCEKGCGPNRYGENCTEICSLLSSRCEGVIFCTVNECSCAPGLKGKNCDTPCPGGWYGASCKQECGKCKDGKPCNSYTGKCYSGCETGYYPPLCQQTYKKLRSTPTIVNIGYTHVGLHFSIEDAYGAGEPLFYEVQYRDVAEKSWSKLAPRVISNETTFNVSGLNAGKQYAIRIILIDKDGGSYQTDVPEATVTTKCIEPEEASYYCTAQKVTTSEISFEWTDSPDENGIRCQFEKFELSFVAGNEKFIFPLNGKKGIKTITGLLPDSEYSFQLIGKTTSGKSVLPPKEVVRTLSAAPGNVRDVQVLPLDVGTKLQVTWEEPWNAEEAKLRYKVTYKCLKLLACENVSCTSSGHVEVETNSVLLEDLKPHALYEIKVVTLSSAGEAAEEYAVNTTTAHAAPQAAPSGAENPLHSVTNTSVSIKWLPPSDCTQLNGYLNGYSYTLIDEETKYALRQESVLENIPYATFSDLVPRHCYELHVTVAASGGTNWRNVLVIPFCTTSAAPDQVQALEVYKKSRRMVGLRWDLPRNPYGDIESFTISYYRIDKVTNKSVLVEPKRCEAWPDLYCHTVTNLSPGKTYKFVVQARNKEVDVDGEATSVEAITTEGVSTPPRNLRIINATESSVLLEWDIPDNINGQLRSFLVVTEQIDTNADSGDLGNCCNDIPIEDYRVTSEQPSYTNEITSLSPASMYSVAVAAKTVSVGEEARITVHTLPPKPKLPDDALTVEGKGDCSSECDTVSLKIRPAAGITGMNRTYILLLLSNSSRATTEFDDNDVARLLRTKFGNNYHIVSEHTEEEIEEEPVITFPNELSLENEALQKQKYALVVIQEYLGKKSMDVFVAEHH